MFDYCLKNIDENEFNTMMIGCGLCIETSEGIMPASYQIVIDRIGPITIIDPSGKTIIDSEGNTVPATITYPEYYSNLRLLVEPSDIQKETLALYAIDPSQPQYRVWLS